MCGGGAGAALMCFLNAERMEVRRVIMAAEMGVIAAAKTANRGVLLPSSCRRNLPDTSCRRLLQNELLFPSLVFYCDAFVLNGNL